MSRPRTDPAMVRWPRWLVGISLGLGYLAIMVPLFFVLLFANRADDRSEKQDATICGMAISIGHLSNTLDTALDAFTAQDREGARERLRLVITEGRAEADAAKAKCQ